MSSPRWSRGSAGASPGRRRRSIRRSGPMPEPARRMTNHTEPRAESKDRSAALYRLLAWLSPSFPTGAFSYSHGLEAGAEAGAVYDRTTLQGWIAAIIEHGSGRIDTDILRDAYRAAEAGDPAALTAANRRGIAFRATSELALESAQQGEAFLGTCVTAWPDPFLAQWADQKNPSPPFRGDREGPDGQRILAGLEPLIASAAAAGKRRDPADFGSATFAVDLASMAHETQYSRLFRS